MAEQVLRQRTSHWRVHGAYKSTTREPMDQPGNQSMSQWENHQEHLWHSRQVNLLVRSKVGHIIGR
jgi:hypothetical protein